MRVLFFALLLLVSAAIWGADPAPRTVPAKPAAQMTVSDPAGSGPERSKSLSFEDSVVENLKRNTLDSAENLSSRDKRKFHLYKLRSSLRPEMRETLRESGYMP